MKRNKMLLLCLIVSLFSSFIGLTAAQDGTGWDDSGEGWDDTTPTPLPTPTSSPNPSNQVINNEYSLMPLLTLLAVVVIGGAVLLAFRGEMDGQQLIGTFTIIILIGVGAAIAIAILANIQTVINAWVIILNWI